jgi:myo-inositol-1(or 4)-monophosphatase
MRLSEALLVTGFPYDLKEDLTGNLRLFTRFMGASRAIRRDGSAALDLCHVAAGRFDGFWEEKLGPWDTAAGALIVEEAGGRVSDLAGDVPLPRGAIVASIPSSTTNDRAYPL